ncbi:MAG: TetR/AcrR family transcriptional regulator [Bacteroidota bacterium]|nr:TetR/AcrR family transcriptional regulator [Bacteroidota bacterium]
MDVYLNIELNEKLFLRNPIETELGKKIIKHSIFLIHKIGFDAFTFKKLALEIGTTEAGVYRYFENKHLLLLYIVDWYWSWQEYRLILKINNVVKPETKLKKVIQLLCTPITDDISTPYINENLLYEIVMSEGAKTYLTKLVSAYNKEKLFKPYKDFCVRISEIILENNRQYKFPRSLASTIIEMSHSQNYYVKNLPSLSDLKKGKEENVVHKFIESLVFSSIKQELLLSPPEIVKV